MLSIGRRGIGEEGCNAGQCFVLFGVEDVEDGADEQRVARLFPVVTPFDRAFGVDQNIRNVLDVAYLLGAAPDLEKRVVRRRPRIRRIEQQAMREPRPPTRGQCPVLALDVVHDHGRRPGEQCRHDQADALAAARRRKAQHVLGTGVPEVLLAEAAEIDSGRLQQPRLAHLRLRRPACRAIGRDQRRLPCATHRAGDRNDNGHDTAPRGPGGAFEEDARGVCVEVVPPREEQIRLVDRHSGGEEPGVAERRLEAQTHCRPFGGAPQTGEDRRQRKRHLAPEDLRSGHRPLAGEIERDRNRRSAKSRAIPEFGSAEPSVAKQRNTYPVSCRRAQEQVCVATAGKERCWSLYASCMFATDKSSACSIQKRKQPS